MIKKYISFLFFGAILTLSAQDIDYSRLVLNELASNKYHGRGYVNIGDKLAANYIEKQFKELGVLPANNGSYFQKLKMDVNTFPKTVEVYCNNVLLKPGVDYIINPSCGRFKFHGEIDFFTANELNDPKHYDVNAFQLKAAVLDSFNAQYFENASITRKKFLKDYKKELLVFLTNDKLTWGASQDVSPQCIITIKRSAVSVSKKMNFKIVVKNKFIANYNSQNVLGLIKGEAKYKDSFIVFTAHYDHLGKMGNEAVFNGANDNASGIAMMLNLAKHYAKNPPKYNLLFIAFTGEEMGLVGSKYYVQNPVYPLSNIRFLINIDLMGNGAEGVMAVNGTVFKDEFELLKKLNTDKNYLPAVKARGKAANSDHYFFSEAGVPCFFFYLMGPYPYYHDVFDRAEEVPFTNYKEAFLLFRDFIDALSN